MKSCLVISWMMMNFWSYTFWILFWTWLYIMYIFVKGGSDLVWYSIDRDIFNTESIFLLKKQINPVRSRIGLPRSLLTINTWYKMINLLPCLIYDFNQLFQFNWNIFFKHILDGLKLNFKSIDSKINWPQFFCNNSFSTCFDFFLQKNGLSFEDVSVYRIPH